MVEEEGMTSPFSEALLAIEICVDALHKADTPEAREALEQVAHLGFDTRSTGQREALSAVERLKRGKIGRRL